MSYGEHKYGNVSYGGGVSSPFRYAGTVVSDPSNTVATTVETTEWWLKDPTDPSRNMRLDVLGPTKIMTRHAESAKFNPIGRRSHIMVTDVIKAYDSTLNFDLIGYERKQQWDELYELQIPLLLQSPARRQWYIMFGNRLQETLENTRDPYYLISIDWHEVERP